MHTYVTNELFPQLLNERRNATMRPDMTMDEVLRENGLKKVTMSTMYNWMRSLKFSYQPRSQNYYIDGHEYPATVEDRIRYIKKYVKEDLCCYRWIQITEEEANELEDNNDCFEKESGYRYEWEMQTYYEYHVDDHESFQQRCNNDENCPFGGYLSVRMPLGTKPIIKIGQDESVFKQFSLTKKQWYLPDGTSVPNPKSEGDGVMYSAFVSRDFGFGHNLSDAQLQVVNKYWRNNNLYLDEEAAIKVYNRKTKAPLTTSPFIREFDYGSNQDGYWCYETMVIQFEDTLDCLWAIYQDQHR